MEVYQLLPEGTLCEVIDNTLFMSPAPTTDHQRILIDLLLEIGQFLKTKPLGEVFVTPCDVYLDHELTVVQPDITFISKEKSDIVRKKGIYGAPDLIIEILSTNIHHDKKRKLEVYERNGVAEYIIIDPETKENWHYLLTGGKYLLTEEAESQLTISQLGLTVSY
jgi:Uma2 family endonuclease